MTGQGNPHTAETLVEELGRLAEMEADQDDEHRQLLHAVAVLWTWLEGHMLVLGSLREKPMLIRESVELGGSSFDGITEAEIERVAESPIRNAAELLARIDAYLGFPSAPFARLAKGVAGRDVVVAWRRPALARALHDNPTPPGSVEHPSLMTLAPRLLVSPIDFNGISLNVSAPSSEHWERAMRVLEKGIAPVDETATREGRQRGSRLEVHLDTLGPHGLSGWSPPPDARTGCFKSCDIDGNDEERCVEAAEKAIENASKQPSVLVMPELAATPTVLEGIEAKLSGQRGGPGLTVVGMYHDEPADRADVDPSLADEAQLATHVNEAVVLGPTGAELWRHRKLSCAQLSLEGRDDPVAEDIRLGTELRVIPTPLGMVAVVICLDAFAPHVRERLVASPADVLLIPSLSPHVHRHRDSLQHLVQVLWGIAFVCNRAVETREGEGEETIWNSDRTRSFAAGQRQAAIPVQPSPDSHPSFVFKLSEPIAETAEDT